MGKVDPRMEAALLKTVRALSTAEQARLDPPEDTWICVDCGRREPFAGDFAVCDRCEEEVCGDCAEEHEVEHRAASVEAAELWFDGRGG